MDKNIIYEDIAGTDIVRLTAKEGYRLYNLVSRHYYANGSNAYRRNLREWIAVAIDG